MSFTSVPEGLAIDEGPYRFVLALPDSPAPIDEVLIYAACGIVCRSPECDGKVRAEARLLEGDAPLALRIVMEFLGRGSRG